MSQLTKYEREIAAARTEREAMLAANTPAKFWKVSTSRGGNPRYAFISNKYDNNKPYPMMITWARAELAEAAFNMALYSDTNGVTENGYNFTEQWRQVAEIARIERWITDPKELDRIYRVNSLKGKAQRAEGLATRIATMPVPVAPEPVTIKVRASSTNPNNFAVILGLDDKGKDSTDLYHNEAQQTQLNEFLAEGHFELGPMYENGPKMGDFPIYQVLRASGPATLFTPAWNLQTSPVLVGYVTDFGVAYSDTCEALRSFLRSKVSQVEVAM